MNKRKKLSKKERESIYNMFDGRCAYCGCEIEYDNFQADHIISLAGHNGSNEIENMFPSCRSCNFYKDTFSIEDFRKRIMNLFKVQERDNAVFRIGVRFGTIIENANPVVFYFEREQR